MNSTLARHFERSRVARDVHVLAQLPTVERVFVYPDVLGEPLGIGFPVGVCFTTGGSDPMVFPNGVTDVNDGYRLVRLGVEADELRSVAGSLLEAASSLRTPWPLGRGIAALACGDWTDLEIRSRFHESAKSWECWPGGDDPEWPAH
ncbi:MAG: hypothetical protein C4321_06735, partial [Chloroflexota bacterium]